MRRLFLLTLVAVALFTKTAPGSAHEYSRFGTVESLVERGTLQLDDSIFIGTVDKIFRDGHYYSHQPPLLVIWNGSPSVPVGLYLVTKASPRVGDLVVLRLPPVIAAFAARRGYLPTSAYLLKPIAAVAGDLVCRLGQQVLVHRCFAGFAETADEVAVR